MKKTICAAKSNGYSRELPLRFAVYILLLIALQLVAVRISLSGTLSIAHIPSRSSAK